MRTALGAIAIQKSRITLVSQDTLQLPREIDDVAHALTHALTQKRGLLMSRIASDEDAAAPPLRCHERMEPVTGASPKLRVSRVNPTN